MFITNNIQINIPHQESYIEFTPMKVQDTYVFVAPELNE